VVVCPTLELSQCAIYSDRAASDGDEARCHPDICSTDVLIETIPTHRYDFSKHADKLHANSDNTEHRFEEIVCWGSNNGVCLGGGKEGGLSKTLIVGIAVGGGGAVIIALLMFICICCPKRSGNNNNRQEVVVNDGDVVVVMYENPPQISDCQVLSFKSFAAVNRVGECCQRAPVAPIVLLTRH
jgi:hypothetical protein